MKTKADPYTRTSFGRFLQKTRIEKGIHLEDVAGKTRIRTQILSAIEKEEHDILPAESFVKGMLKAFARAVGADPVEVLRLYQQDRSAYNDLARQQSRLDKSIRVGWLKLICALGLLVVLATISVYAMTLISRKMNANTASEKESRALSNLQTGETPKDDAKKAGATNKKTENSATVNGSPNPKTGASDKQSTDAAPTIRMDGYLLSIHAIKNTWIKVIADDQAAVKYRLKMGDRLDLTAASRFNMLIGDADGVRLMLNDQRVPIAGKSGQIVNIEIP